MKIAGRYIVVEAQRGFACFVGLLLEVQIVPVGYKLLERHGAGEANGVHAGDGSELFGNVVLRPRHHRPVSDEQRRNGDTQGLNVRWVRVARVDVAQSSESTNH